MPSSKNAITHPFSWYLTNTPLTSETAQKYGLVGGVLATEGKSKNGDIIDAEHILQGTGSLHMLALGGKALCYIDHIYEKLPDAYVEKHGKELVEQSAPAGIILDTAAVKNEDGKYRTEFIAATRPAIYQAVKEGKIRGNSLHDLPRINTCDKSECKSQTSSYVNNSFMLDAVPSMDGTYVRSLTADDVDMINKNSQGVRYAETPEVAKELEENWDSEKEEEETIAAIPPVAPKEVTNAPAASPPSSLLSAYRNANGGWLAEDSLEKYLTDAKSLPGPIAQQIAQHAKKNPDSITMRMLEHYNTDNFFGYYNAVQTTYAMQRLDKLEQKVKKESPLKGVHIVDGVQQNDNDTPNKHGLSKNMAEELMRKQNIFKASADSINIPRGMTRGAAKHLMGQKYSYEKKVKDIHQYLNANGYPTPPI